jgi:transcriptional regulator with XRE-family HTH domain
MKYTSELLKRFRIRSGLSQLQLAKKMGWTTGQFVSKVERVEAGLSPKNAKKVAEILSINHKLMKGALIRDAAELISKEYK